MTDKNKKIKIPSLDERKKVHERKIEELELKNKLLGSPELFITEKGSDEYLDTLSIKIRLNGGREFTYEEYLSENIVSYTPHFYKEYYYEIARLYNLDKSVMDGYQKPQCVAFFTIQFIYARFPKKVVDALMSRSPWTEIPGIRSVKLFQHLSFIATEQLDLYIDQIVDVMQKSETMVDFKAKYSREYKLYFQIDMFTDTDVISKTEH